MRLVDTVIAVIFAALFCGIFVQAFPSFASLIKERRSIEYELTRDKFLSTGFEFACQEEDFEIEQWVEEMNSIYKFDIFEVRRLYCENPRYLELVCRENNSKMLRKIVRRSK